MNERTQIPGAEQLVAVFGSWPPFHDAEVQWLRLDRHAPWGGRDGPAINVQIHAFEMTSEIDANRIYVRRNHVLVHLRFSEVNEIQMEGFNQQNVLFDMDSCRFRLIRT